MGRRRKSNLHLPPRVHIKCGAYWHVSLDDAGQRRWRRLAGLNDYGAALRAYADIEGGARQDDDKTVAMAIHAYLGACAARVKDGDLSAKTLTGYKQCSTELLRVFGRVQLLTLTDRDVRMYREARVVAPRKQPVAGEKVVLKKAPTQANRELALLSVSYANAAEMGWIAASVNPCKGVKRNKERARQRYVTDEELRRILRFAPTRLQAAIRISVVTGMRQTDLLQLRLADIGVDGLAVTPSKTRRTGKSVIYKWTPELRAAVDVARKTVRRVGSLWLFPGNSHGEHMTKDGLDTIWFKCKEEAGLPDIQWRDLRRKAGSDTTEAHATELLQHSNPATTKKHYRAKPTLITPTH